MNIKATSPGKFVDLRERCGTMICKARCPEEEVFLAAVYNATTRGGTITVKPKKGKPIKMTWDRPE